MARRRRRPRDEDLDGREGPTDDMLEAEANKAMADSEIATRKAQIMAETDELIDRANELTRWTPPR